MSTFTLPRLGLGNWRSYDLATDRAAVARLLAVAAELGVGLLDTSPLYQDGDAERALGRALRDASRAAFLLATKGGARLDGSVDCSPRQLRSDLEGSLERLGVETIDLYQLHHVDPDVPIAETMGALRAFRDEGKIRAFGLANYGPFQLLAANDCGGGIAAVQVRYNALESERATVTLEVARATRIPVIAYSLLAEGLLTGHAVERAGAEGRTFAAKWHVEPWLGRAAELAQAARSAGVTPLELAIGWAARDARLHTLLLGARTEQQLRESVRYALSRQPTAFLPTERPERGARFA